METFFKLIKQKLGLIVSLTIFSSILSIFYALSIDKYYKVNLLMVSSLDSGNQSSLIGGLLGTSQTTSVSSAKVTSEEAIAILSSRKFLEKFIQDRDMLKILFSSLWDSDQNKWNVEAENIPEIKDGYDLIADSLDIRFDKSLITLGLVFHDKDEISKILNNLIDDVNIHIRNISIIESTDNITFLQKEINKTQLSASREMLYRLVESQTQAIMIANTRKDYAFKLIDPAVQPEIPAGPNRKLIVIIGTILGGFFSLIFAMFLNFFNQNKSS